MPEDIIDNVDEDLDLDVDIENDDPTKKDPVDIKSFTQEDVDQFVKDRLSREQVKWDKGLNAQIELKLKEKQRLSELSDDEIMSETMTQREKDIEERENKLQRKELLGDTEQVLRERTLPANFAKFLIADDEDTTLGNIKAFQKAFRDAVKAEVKNELSGKTPPSNDNKKKTLSRHDITAMSDIDERRKRIAENIDLYTK